jgi:hypothetical protein
VVLVFNFLFTSSIILFILSPLFFVPNLKPILPPLAKSIDLRSECLGTSNNLGIGFAQKAGPSTCFPSSL